MHYRGRLCNLFLWTLLHFLSIFSLLFTESMEATFLITSPDSLTIPNLDSVGSSYLLHSVNKDPPSVMYLPTFATQIGDTRPKISCCNHRKKVFFLYKKFPFIFVIANCLWKLLTCVTSNYILSSEQSKYFDIVLLFNFLSRLSRDRPNMDPVEVLVIRWKAGILKESKKRRQDFWNRNISRLLKFWGRNGYRSNL